MSKSRKRMSLKEFKRIFEKAYGKDTFEFYGYEFILNKMSLCEDYQAKERMCKGFKSSANRTKETSNIIYAELDNIGYYDDL